TVTQPPSMYNSASRREQPIRAIRRLDRRWVSDMQALGAGESHPAGNGTGPTRPALRFSGEASDQLGPQVVFVGIDDAHAHLVTGLQLGRIDEHAAVDFRRIRPGARHGAFLV